MIENPTRMVADGQKSICARNRELACRRTTTVLLPVLRANVARERWEDGSFIRELKPSAHISDFRGRYGHYRRIEVGLLTSSVLSCMLGFRRGMRGFFFFNDDQARLTPFWLEHNDTNLPDATAAMIGRAIAIYLVLVFIPLCSAQTSAWIFNSGSGDWFDATHWDNGIPNAAGAVAQIPGGGLSIQLNQQATVGELDLLSPRQTTLSGTGTLVFDLPGDSPAMINAPQSITGSGVTASINTPIAIASGEQLTVNIDLPAPLHSMPASIRPLAT